MNSRFLKVFLAALESPQTIPCSSPQEARRRQNQFHSWRRKGRLKPTEHTQELNRIVVKRVKNTVVLISHATLRQQMEEELKQIYG